MFRVQRWLSAALVSLALAVLSVVVGACGGNGEGVNLPPIIVSGISLPTGTVEAGERISLQVIRITDPDGDPVTYTWSARFGTVDPVGPTQAPTTEYTAPEFAGDESVTVIVSDGRGGVTTDAIEFQIVVAAAENTPTPPGPTPTVEITNPTDGGEVVHSTQVRGTSSNISPDQDIWLVVQPHLAPQFHPQPGPVAQGQDGEWIGTAFFGESPSRNIGEGFELIVVLATREASQAFREYLDQSSRTGSFPGLAFLLDGTEIEDQITVTRR